MFHRNWMYKLKIYKSFHNVNKAEKIDLIAKLRAEFPQVSREEYQRYERTIEIQTQFSNLVHESKNYPIYSEDKGGGRIRRTNQSKVFCHR